MSDQLKHASHLLITSLVQQHFVPRVGLCLIQLCDFCGRSASAVFQSNSTPESFDAAFRRHTLHFNFVNFLDAVTRRRYVVCEVAVVRKQQQTFSVEVETSDRMELSERRR